METSSVLNMPTIDRKTFAKCMPILSLKNKELFNPKQRYCARSISKLSSKTWKGKSGLSPAYPGPSGHLQAPGCSPQAPDG
ncbi:hypothetical protein TNCV_3738071 [Trichonephila clavipes]|nr:hypothetical protein TNCV_3738071 [Trichonephila clavipes]